MKHLFQIFVFSISASVLVGCVSGKIEITPTKAWEGHFYTADEFHAKTAEIKLEKKETIWVLSNATLSRVLKNLNMQVKN